MISRRQTLPIMMLTTMLTLSGCATVENPNRSPGGVTRLPETSAGLPNAYLEWDAVRKSQPAQSYEPTLSLTSVEQMLQKSNIAYEVERGEYLLLKLSPTIEFATDQYTLSMAHKTQLAQVSAFLSTQPDIDIVVEGHTDREGNELYNEALSRSRASSVADYLYSRGVAQRQLFVRGFGDAMPLCSNHTNQGRACNRRVEIALVVRD